MQTVIKYSVVEYIDKFHGGSQVDFSRHLTSTTRSKVWPQMVTEWINKGYIIVDHKLYSFRRVL